MSTTRDGRFGDLCNTAMVELEAVGAGRARRGGRAGPAAPALRLGVEDNGMGDMLRFDAERLRILVERHHLHTGSARARELLEDWDAALALLRQGDAEGLPPRAARRCRRERARDGRGRRRANQSSQRSED